MQAIVSCSVPITMQEIMSYMTNTDVKVCTSIEKMILFFYCIFILQTLRAAAVALKIKQLSTHASGLL